MTTDAKFRLLIRIVLLVALTVAHKTWFCYGLSVLQNLRVDAVPEMAATTINTSRRGYFVLSTCLFIGLPLDSIAAETSEKDTTGWVGTNLKLQSLDEAVGNIEDCLYKKQDDCSHYWLMGRWPDPILRRPADPIDSRWYGTPTLQRAARLLSQTAIHEGAVGLAAQQCGVNARMVYLQPVNKIQKDGIVLINPQIIARSPEEQMTVWIEECLVLPPKFRATVLRDAWVDVQFYSIHGGPPQTMRLRGEQSRCIQHELDHDRGILITDHIGLEEMENDMRKIESEGHDQRMKLAYSRYIMTTT
jgi:peptide deformylase